MKTIEEKAEAYDEVFRTAQELYNNPASSQIGKDWICAIFPELKESEDDEIRKEIINFIKRRDRSGCDYDYDKWITWLEKQGEQEKSYDTCNSSMFDNKKSPYGEKRDFGYFEEKPTDKVKPKFKVGDWIVNNISKDIFLIKSINNGYCTLEDIKGNIISPCLPPIESESHLWNIRDAKDGDIIVCPKYAGDIIPNIFIFKGITVKDNDVICHCSFSKAFISTEHYIASADSINTDFYPATKEQRDTLFKAMADAGYTFDFEKKVIKKRN